MYTGNFVKYNNIHYIILKIINKSKIKIIDQTGNILIVDKSSVTVIDCTITQARQLLSAKFKEKNKKSEIFVKVTR